MRTLYYIKKQDRYMRYALSMFLFITVQIGSVKADKGNGKLVLDISYKEAKPSDTLILKLGNIFIDLPSETINETFYATMNRQGRFRFEVPVSKECGYFKLLKKRTFTTRMPGHMMALMEDQFWEMGDSLSINLSHQESRIGIHATYSFNGIGAVKYTAKYAIENLTFDKSKNDIELKKSRAFNGNIIDSNNLNKLSAYRQMQLALLNEYKEKMSELSYGVLKAQVVYKMRTGIFYDIRKFYSDSLSHAVNNQQVKFRRAFDDLFLKPLHQDIAASTLSNSTFYLRYLLAMHRIRVDLTGEPTNQAIYQSLVENAEGDVRERLIVMFLSTIRPMDDLKQLSTAAEEIITLPDCIKILKEIKQRIRKGRFSDFALEDINGKRIKLSDFYGKVVLLDFWYNGCGYCREYYRGTLSKVEKVFGNNPNVVFISISADIKKERWLAGIESGNYTSKEVINVNTGGLGSQHSVMKKNNIRAFPTVILLNKESGIAHFNSTLLYQHNSLVDAINALL